MKILPYVVILTFLSLNITAQNVNIPDANFKSYLVGQPAINTNLDSEIQVTEAQAYSAFINCSGLSISDLTGIEAFTALTNLNFSNNQIATVDLLQNTALTTLNCSNNPTTSLILPNGSNLTTLDASSIQLQSMDLSMLTGLTSVQVQNSTSLSSLNVANGNNEDFNTFDASNTPNLACVTVDNVSYSDAVWIPWGSIDSGDQFSLDCSTLGTSNVDLNSKLKIYPVPVKSDVFISSEFRILKTAIFSISGQKLLEEENTNHIDLSKLATGVYTMNIITNEGIVRKKIIKE